MTIKQGQDINQRFMDLTSEIKTLRDSISKKNSEVISLINDKTNLNNSLNTISIKSRDLESENIKLNLLLKRNKELFSNEQKKWAGWMFFSFVVTVMVGALK